MGWDESKRKELIRSKNLAALVQQADRKHSSLSTKCFFVSSSLNARFLAPPSFTLFGRWHWDTGPEEIPLRHVTSTSNSTCSLAFFLSFLAGMTLSLWFILDQTEVENEVGVISYSTVFYSSMDGFYRSSGGYQLLNQPYFILPYRRMIDGSRIKGSSWYGCRSARCPVCLYEPNK